MPYPPAPDLSYSYTAAEQALGDGSLPGQELDVDLAALQAAVIATIEFLKVTHRSDGKLANGSVTEDALGSSIRIGFEPPAPWAATTDYTTRSTVFSGFGFYLCVIPHTSAALFATDLSAGRWQLLADLTPPGGALIASNNLTDVPNKAAGRASLELQTMAQAVAGTGGTEFRNNGQNDTRFAQRANNGSDFASAATVLTNLGLTATAAELNQLDNLTPSPRPTTSAGLGQYVLLAPGAGNALVLGAGGTWAYHGLGTDASGNVVSFFVNIAAGGTQIQPATGGTNWVACAWRIT